MVSKETAEAIILKQLMVKSFIVFILGIGIILTLFYFTYETEGYKFVLMIAGAWQIGKWISGLVIRLVGLHALNRHIS